MTMCRDYLLRCGIHIPTAGRLIGTEGKGGKGGTQATNSDGEHQEHDNKDRLKGKKGSCQEKVNSGQTTKRQTGVMRLSAREMGWSHRRPPNNSDGTPMFDGPRGIGFT